MVRQLTPDLLQYNHNATHPMRYNPATDRARYTLDEIAAQCRAAILKADAQRTPYLPSYDDVLEFSRWEDDVLIAA